MVGWAAGTQIPEQDGSGKVVVRRDDVAAGSERARVQLTRMDPAHMRLRVLDTRASELRGHASLLPSK